MRPARRPLFFVVLAALLAAAGVSLLASESRQINSAWRDRDVRIDGVDEEWRDLTTPVKGQRFAVGFVNDGEALYFCLLTKDAATVRQITRAGLIVWLDPAGGKKKTFGVRFPVGYGPMGGEGRQKPRESEPVPPGGTATEGQAAWGQGDVQVLGPGRNDVRDLENGRSGVAARYSLRGDLLVYELKVPLNKSEEAPFGLNVTPGAALRVELQTPEWRGPVPMRRGGPRIGIGVGRPGGGVFYPGADTSLLKPLDVAAELRLATEPGR